MHLNAIFVIYIAYCTYVVKVLRRPAQSVPSSDRLLWSADHVHPVLQLWAPGIHEGTQYQHSQ